jgi:LPXTG-site transpeptidase (sortase) family protein
MTDQNTSHSNDSQSQAADLIRAKLAHIYATEPEVEEEISEIVSTGTHSKHQEFIKALQTSGKTAEETQVAWHNYYQALPDDEKHEVWREFHEYKPQATLQTSKAPDKEQMSSEADNITHTQVQDYYIYRAHEAPHKPTTEATRHQSGIHEELRSKALKRYRSHPISTHVSRSKALVLDSLSGGGKVSATHHIKSGVFAIGFASLITGLLFFVTNNERFIAPFIQPSLNASAAPLITDGQTVGLEPKLVIPKINLEAPLVTDVADNTEETIQDNLEKGIVLYPNTGKPGEQSNPIFFGHSSNNLFNKGAYKFVFVRLHQLEVGDTYAIQYNGVQYVYKIFDRTVVDPTQVEVLTEIPRPSMSTLITCDPPGTSDKRLVIRAEQISPSPASNATSTALSDPNTIKTIPSNSPSFLSRLFGR